MNVLNKLTINSLKLNKKRTIVTIIGIMLSVALMTAVTTMYQSLCTSLINYEKAWQGNFHASFKGVDKEGIENIKNNRSIEKVNFITTIGYAEIETKNDYKPYACVVGVEENIYDNLGIRLVEGRFPENDSEVVIPTHLESNGRNSLSVGEKVELEVGKRVGNDGTEYNQNIELMVDGEKNERMETITDTVKKEYTVVGIIERPSRYVENYAAPGYTFITKVNKIEDKVDAYCRWKKSSFDTFYKDIGAINGLDGELFAKLFDSDISTDSKEYKAAAKEAEKMKYTTDFNSYLLGMEDSPLTNESNRGLLIVILIVLIIVVVSSVFCIKNSFDISITEKIRQYGMLRSIGATKRQIRRNVLYEATILGIIGIISGLILGILASVILVNICNYLLKFASNVVMELDISLVAILVALFFSIVTIYLSALRSAIKASKVSPIQSIRNSGEIKIKAKKLRAPKFINKLYGIGGEISYKNIKRNRKKYRTTVISITVSAVIFIALTYFMNLAMIETDNELKVGDYNFTIRVNNAEDNKVCDDIVTLDNIKKYVRYYDADIKIKGNCYSKEYIDFFKLEDLNENDYECIRFMALDEKTFKDYAAKLELNVKDIKDGAILMNYETLVYYKNKEKTVKTIGRYKFKEGDVIKGVIDNNKDGETEIKVVKCTDVEPYGFKGQSPVMLVVNYEYYKDYVSEVPAAIRLFSENATKLQDDLDKEFEEGMLYVDNAEENQKNVKNVYTMIGIFLYGFITVITLIGITNIFNTITTSVYLRKREFATLRSVGMTNKEFNKMIRLESFFIGAEALVFGIPIGIILSYMMHKSLTLKTAFIPPFKTILITILAVFLLIFIIMNYSLSKIKSQNTIETIRNENI